MCWLKTESMLGIETQDSDRNEASSNSGVVSGEKKEASESPYEDKDVDRDRKWIGGNSTGWKSGPGSGLEFPEWIDFESPGASELNDEQEGVDGDGGGEYRRTRRG